MFKCLFVLHYYIVSYSPNSLDFLNDYLSSEIYIFLLSIDFFTGLNSNNFQYNIFSTISNPLTIIAINHNNIKIITTANKTNIIRKD